MPPSPSLDHVTPTLSGCVLSHVLSPHVMAEGLSPENLEQAKKAIEILSSLLEKDPAGEDKLPRTSETSLSTIPPSLARAEGLASVTTTRHPSTSNLSTRRPSTLSLSRPSTSRIPSLQQAKMFRESTNSKYYNNSVFLRGKPRPFYF